MGSESRYRNRKYLKREYREALKTMYFFSTSESPYSVSVVDLGIRNRIEENSGNKSALLTASVESVIIEAVQRYLLNSAWALFLSFFHCPPYMHAAFVPVRVVLKKM